MEFRILGPLEVRRSGEPIAIRGRRQRGLLAFLLLRSNTIVSNEEIMDRLWGTSPPENARNSIQVGVSQLRKVLEPAGDAGGAAARLVTHPGGYALEIDSEQLDLTRFERLRAAGRSAAAGGDPATAALRLSEALTLWRGAPFADFVDEPLARFEAAALEDARLTALEDRIEADLALGRHAEVVHELEGLVASNPLRERLRAQLMLALYRSGRQAEALEVYRGARRELVEELGLEPGAALQELERAILRQDAALDAPPLPDRAEPMPLPHEPRLDAPPFIGEPEQRHNLPAAVTSFVGRKAELEELERLLGEARLVTLTGVGGAGKTRLALEAAARALPDRPDGVFFCDLAPLAEPTLVAVALAGALGVREQAGAEMADRLVARLREADLLLVIDNCEHLRAACAELIRRLLATCGRLRVLATSRELLGVPGEVDYPVPPLALPASDADPDELRSSEAVSLFLARAREARPHLPDEAAQLATAARICSDLDGLPLAIELAAARAKALSLEEIAARIGDRFQFLVSSRRVTAARHRTLMEAMDWSYALLPEEERTLLARLSVFAGGFTLEAAAAVCLEGDEERALELVGHLVDASLIVADEHEGQTRYRLLETVRQYAAGRLDEAAGLDATRRHAEYFLAVAERTEVELVGPRQATELARLELEHDNLRAALAWMLRAGESDFALRLASALWRFWHIRGHFAEGRAWLERALGTEADPPPHLLANALGAAARLTGELGDLEAADAYAERSLELHRRHHLAGLRSALGTRAYVLLLEGELDRAAALHEEAIEVSRQTGDRQGEAINVQNLGNVHLSRGDYQEAGSLLRQSVELQRQLGRQELLGFALQTLGQVALHQGRYDQATTLLEESLVVCRQVGSKAGLIDCLETLAAVAAAQDRAGDAALLLGCAQEMEDEIGLRLQPFDQALHDKTELSAIEALGEDAFARERARGREMMPEEAFAHVLPASAVPAQP